MINKLSNIKERILYLAENQEGNKQTFFKKLGVTYGNFTGSNKKRPVSSDTIAKILLHYPKTNIEWLVTGKGFMLKENSVQQTKVASNSDEQSIKNKLISSQEKTIVIQAKEISRLEQKNRQLTKKCEKLKYRIDMLKEKRQ